MLISVQQNVWRNCLRCLSSEHTGVEFAFTFLPFSFSLDFYSHFCSVAMQMLALFDISDSDEFIVRVWYTATSTSEWMRRRLATAATVAPAKQRSCRRRRGTLELHATTSGVASKRSSRPGGTARRTSDRGQFIVIETYFLIYSMCACVCVCVWVILLHDWCEQLGSNEHSV